MIVRLQAFRLALALLPAACAGEPEKAGTAATPTAETRVRPGLRFDPATMTPGTVIGVLTLDSVALQRAYDSSYVGSARFSGEIEVSGATLRNPDPDLGLRLTCFEADSASAARLPRWSEDARRSWFCFTNNDEAARSLGPPSEGVRATIVIDEFTIYRNMSDAVNSARFRRLVAGGSPR